ncbi:CHAT domain-containing protein [Streptomyces sp. AHU1]|uniref:CHAT domain-containing protein n=1 Tax=Streptomyces sp. AHU1 TaxID=3377215 RepID=UPI003878192C
MEGLPFRIDIIESDTQWIVRCSSECGEATIRVSPPYSLMELKSELAEVRASLARSSSAEVTRGPATAERPVRDFGKRLAQSILKDAISIQFDRCRGLAKQEGKALRVLLRPDGPQVCRIPWEYMVDPFRDDYLALCEPVVRDLQLMDRISPIALTLPLRVLGISSLPSDLPVLEEQREREQIAQALQRKSSDNVDVHWLTGDRWADLADALRSDTWHVLHCICHGGFDEESGGGYIQLSGDSGSAMRVDAADFARRIRKDCPHLRLVVLNACESAVSGKEGVFTSTAASVVRAGVPAVVAMQYEITDKAAVVFASSFYELVAEGLPVDRAVMSAREVVKMSLGSLEWATPVLFLRSDTTQLFAPEPDSEPQSIPKPKPVSEPPVSRPEPNPPRPPSPPQPSERIGVLAETGPCSHLAVGPGDLLAAACHDGLVRVYEALNGELVAHCVPEPPAQPLWLSWSPWRRHLASRHEDGTVVVWDLRNETPLRVIGTRGQGSVLAFSSNGLWLAVTGESQVHIYNTRGVLVRELEVRPGAVRLEKKGRARKADQGAVLGPVGFTPDDRHIIVACGEGPVLELNGHGQFVREWPHRQVVLSLACSEDFLATGCQDGQVRLWSWNGSLIWRRGQGAPVRQLALSTDRSVLAAADDEGNVSIRDLSTGNATSVAKLANSCPVGLAFRKNDEGLLTADCTGAVEWWSLSG